MITRHRLIRSAGALLAAAPVGLLRAQGHADCAPADCSAKCGPTGAAVEGPFFVRNVAPAVDINGQRAPGKPMRVSGVVQGGADGRTLLAGAKVEIWHCDSDGNYHPNGNGDVSRYRPAEINLRGSTVTDAQGRFAFDSIVPGIYGGRRRHIHWRFEASGHQAVTTQTYWLKDKGSLGAAADFVDRMAESCRWLAFATGPRGVEHAVFAVQLTKA